MKGFRRNEAVPALCWKSWSQVLLTEYSSTKYRTLLQEPDQEPEGNLSLDAQFVDQESEKTTQTNLVANNVLQLFGMIPEPILRPIIWLNAEQIFRSFLHAVHVVYSHTDHT